MQNKSKINLYDIKVAKNISSIFVPKKSILNVKITLFTVLAITTFASIGQSLVSFSSKTSLAKSNTQISSVLSSSSSNIAK